jgi:putative ABC transport system permease protein
VGIRKIHGASVTQILILLSSGYNRLVLLAFIISAPVAWYFTNGWLSRFAFHTNVALAEFVLAGALRLLVAGFTVVFRSFRAATTNPVNTLREE